MYGYRRSSWEDAVASEVTFLLVILAIVAIAALATLLVAAGKEIGRIVQASASYSERTRQVIKMSIIGFIALLLLCGALWLVFPALGPIPIYLAAWGFLVFVLLIEVCDWSERRNERVDESALGHLDTYLDFSGANTAAEPSGVPAGVSMAAE